AASSVVLHGLTYRSEPASPSPTSATAAPPIEIAVPAASAAAPMTASVRTPARRGMDEVMRVLQVSSSTRATPSWRRETGPRSPWERSHDLAKSQNGPGGHPSSTGAVGE